MRFHARAGVAALLAAVTLSLNAQSPCDECLRARYWRVPELDYNETAGRPFFPERERLESRRPYDFGIAFSGGGTRSAAATLGQLRGLARNGWLPYVRYISAVSGGAWSAVPFTFTKETDDQILGEATEPESLIWERLQKEPQGELARAIANSQMAATGLREALALAAPAFVSRDIVARASQLLGPLGAGRREPERLNKTYARLIGEKFIDPLVESLGPSASLRLFAWDPESLVEMLSLNPGRLPGNMVLANLDRPFLIAGATMVSARTDYPFPLIMPVEYTPLYVGVRQRFGRFGGAYLWPWAYDAVAVGRAGPDDVEVRYRPDRTFTLADVAASTGAAPQLALLLGAGLPENLSAVLRNAAGLFPAFRHVTVEGRVSALTEELAHGDGGFGDNLGLMPLLARQVRNILVFVNTSTPYFEANQDIESFFVAGGPPGGFGRRDKNAVFPESRYAELMRGLAARRHAGEALLYCGPKWEVLPNSHYNVRGYSGLNVCWFYNARVPQWEQRLKGKVKDVLAQSSALKEAKAFARFPWFDTFKQLKLTTAQVNLLASLSEWVVANRESVETVRAKLSVPLPPP